MTSSSSSTPSITTTTTNKNIALSSLDNRECRSGDGIGIVFSPLAISVNHYLVEYCRTSMSALAGCTAGIIGLSSLQGFTFYAIMVVIFWLMILVKADGSNWHRYFISKWNILTNNFLGGLTTYVLFWTFLYGMVHVY